MLSDMIQMLKIHHWLSSYAQESIKGQMGRRRQGNPSSLEFKTTRVTRRGP